MSDTADLSKTRRKRQALDAQALGVALTALRRDQLEAFALPDRLLAAIRDCQAMTKHEAVRRQRQYIGKLMRASDIDAIAARLAALNAPAARETAEFHRVERWRDQLLADPDAAGRFEASFPGANAAALRTLALEARAEREAGKPPRRYRELFQAISRHLKASPDPEP
jgi:ribosome-associated protein